MAKLTQLMHFAMRHLALLINVQLLSACLLLTMTWLLPQHSALNISENFLGTQSNWQLQNSFPIHTMQIQTVNSQMIATEQDQIIHVFTHSQWQLIEWLNVLQWIALVLIIVCLMGLLLNLIAKQDAKQKTYYKKIMVFLSVYGVMLSFSGSLFILQNGVLNPLMSLAILLLTWVFVTSTKKQIFDSALDRKKEILIAYASQTGSAMSLARSLQKTNKQLMHVQCVSKLKPSQLQGYKNVLFVVSTQGNGEAPDSANEFFTQLQRDELIGHTGFSVLALGDQHYTHFCAFGHRLEDALKQKQAKIISPLVEVNNMDMNAVNQWWQRVSSLLNIQVQAIKIKQHSFKIIENQCLNPTQTHRHAHRIRLYKKGIRYQAGDLLSVVPKQNMQAIKARLKKLNWEASCLVEVKQKVEGPTQSMQLIDALMQLDWSDQQAKHPQALIDQLHPIKSPMTARLYSIASCEKNYIEILVRKHIRADNSVGNASGYLCRLKPNEQTKIEAHIQTHPNFHLVENRAFIMIGSGTGLAPFLGFLQQKQQKKSEAKSWLFFGEQLQECDGYYQAQLEQYQKNNVLNKVNYAWSKTNGEYVQDQLIKEKQDMQIWINQHNAVIYICGSQKGFGESVINCLKQMLTPAQMDERLFLDLY